MDNDNDVEEHDDGVVNKDGVVGDSDEVDGDVADTSSVIVHSHVTSCKLAGQ